MRGRRGALPARLARLARRLAIIFVGEAIAAAALASARRATETSRTSALGLGARLVHLEIAPVDSLSIESGHRLSSFRVVGHFHEAKAAGAPRFPVHRYVHARDLSKGLEQRPKILFLRLKTHVADKQILHFVLLIP